jgi:hypothetical protein
MGLPFWVNACGKSIVPVTAIERRKKPAIKPTWHHPNL